MSSKYEDYTLSELRYIGKKIGVKSPTSLRKKELVDRILEIEKNKVANGIKERVVLIKEEIERRRFDLQNNNFESMLFRKIDEAFLEFVEKAVRIVEGKVD